MSGIVGVLNLDGQPIDRELLTDLTNSLSFRGPDAQAVWIKGNVGFGHTLLRTTFESQSETQPVTIDDQIWLTADARIDGREELIAKLKRELNRNILIPAAEELNRQPNDAELILLAYEAWGMNCCEHLLGDFAFAIWSETTQTLFCARDHFGVKPFYYAHTPNAFIFSNTLDCVRIHPAISKNVDQAAIGDFLLFGFNHNTSTTAFRDIKRLPAAHTLLIKGHDRQLSAHRYWQLPRDLTTTTERPEDYVDEFLTLLAESTKDRLRTMPTSLFMSGGLDSCAVAAAAVRNSGSTRNIVAHTIIHKTLFHDDEDYFSKLTADHLQIPIRYQIADGYELYKGWERPEIRRPEPSEIPLLEMAFDQLRLANEDARVVLTGYGPDPALKMSATLGMDRLSHFQVGKLTKEIAWFVFSQRMLPRMGFRGSLKGKFSKAETEAPFPSWLNPRFVSQNSLRERWQLVKAGPTSTHVERPQGYRSLTDPFWSNSFEGYDPGVTRVPIEVRHPFFDVRMMTYLLSIPVVPWCFNKYLLRESMRGILPEAIRLRPKTVLQGDPIGARVKLHDVAWIDDFKAHPMLLQFVDRALIPKANARRTGTEFWNFLRPLCLSIWLESQESV